MKKLSLLCYLRNHSGVRIRMLPAGYGFLVLTMCGFLMSVNFSNNMIFSMTFLLSGIGIVGWWQTRANLKYLEYGAWRCSPIFAGQKVEYHLAVDNSSRSDRFGVCSFSNQSINEDESQLKAHTQITINFFYPSAARGILKGVTAGLRSRFPIGLFEACLDCGLLPDCLIYPAPSGDQPLPEQLTGQQAHLQKESGDYVDMRRYGTGDPPSRIAWKAFARTDELYTREYDGAKGQPALWLCWNDIKASGVEQKLSQLCRWILDAHHHGREYGLDIPGVVIQPAGEERHQRRCLRELALYRTTEPKS